MTHREFLVILESRIAKMREVLDAKAAEYASDQDRLRNFRSASAIAGNRSPAQVCVGFWLKHVESICNVVDKSAAGKVTPVSVIDEKVGDAINYLVLLEAILKSGG